MKAAALRLVHRNESRPFLWAAALLFALTLACSGSGRPGAASQAATTPDSPAGSTRAEAATGPATAPEEVRGRGSAGSTSREVETAQNNGVIDTGGLPTVVFVDADG